MNGKTFEALRNNETVQINKYKMVGKQLKLCYFLCRVSIVVGSVVALYMKKKEEKKNSRSGGVGAGLQQIDIIHLYTSASI